MSKRITKKDAKIILDENIKKMRDLFNRGEYEAILEYNTPNHGNDVHLMIKHLGGNIMRLNHKLGLDHMTPHEVDEYHRLHGSGFWGNLWKGIKNVGSTIWNGAKTVAKIVRPVVQPVGDLIGSKYGAPGIGTALDKGFTSVGLGLTGGRYRSAGSIGQRKMGPEDY